MSYIKFLLCLPSTIFIHILNLFQKMSNTYIGFNENIFFINQSSNKNDIYVRNANILFYLDLSGVILNFILPFEHFYFNFINLNLVIIVAYLAIEKYISFMNLIKQKLPQPIFGPIFENKFVKPVFSVFTLFFGSLIGVSYILSIYFLELIPLTFTTMFGYALMFIAVILAFIGYFSYIYLMYLIWYIKKEASNFGTTQYQININTTLSALSEISNCFKYLNTRFLVLGLMLSIQYIILSNGSSDFSNGWFIYSYAIIILFVVMAFILFNVFGVKLYNDTYEEVKNMVLKIQFSSYLSENDISEKSEKFNFYNFLYNLKASTQISLLYRLSSSIVSLLTLYINIYSSLNA